MKYKVGAFQHSDEKWEAKYRESEGKIIGKNVVQIPDSFLLQKYFKTRVEADNYTVQFLKSKGINENNIESIN